MYVDFTYQPALHNLFEYGRIQQNKKKKKQLLHSDEYEKHFQFYFPTKNETFFP